MKVLPICVLLCSCLPGCGRPAETATDSLIRSTWLNEGGGYENYFADGTMTIAQMAGHESWRIEGDKLLVSKIPTRDDPNEYVTYATIWRDPNHLVLVDMRYKKDAHPWGTMSAKTGSELTPQEMADHRPMVWRVHCLVRVCPETEHGNQHY